MRSKKKIKKLFVSLAFSGSQKIVIASSGRSGSTMLFGAIADSLIQHRFNLGASNFIAKKIKRLCTGYVDRIYKLSNEPYLICKTHDTFKHLTRTHDKFIFVYGDPLDSAMSVQQVVQKEGLEWFVFHQYHLNASGSYKDLYKKDVLNYRGQLESWLTQELPNIICIDYDDLWGEREKLSNFLRFNIDLPPRRSRREKPKNVRINKELFSQLRELKDRLKKEYKSPIEH